jgi:hypothetical protein
MNNIFHRTNAYWAKYDEYVYRQGECGHLYIMPAPKSQPSVYDPVKDTEKLVLSALNLGRLAMKQGDGQVIEAELKKSVMEFVTEYGLLGFMPGLPTTPEFMSYDAVYLPKNHFIKDETMTTRDYLSLFFPFGKPDIYKDREKAQWNVNAAEFSEGKVLALAMTYGDEPLAVGMSLMPLYAERFDWLVTQFRDWAFMLVSSFLFYEYKDDMDDYSRELYQQGVSAFGGKYPTYRIRMYDNKPGIRWDFHSLLLTIQTMFGFALVDESRPLRICRHCNLAFIANHHNADYCSPQCKNQHNVSKSRGKKKQDTEE